LVVEGAFLGRHPVRHCNVLYGSSYPLRRSRDYADSDLYSRMDVGATLLCEKEGKKKGFVVTVPRFSNNVTGKS
jgi:hypothetical protein